MDRYEWMNEWMDQWINDYLTFSLWSYYSFLFYTFIPPPSPSSTPPSHPSQIEGLLYKSFVTRSSAQTEPGRKMHISWLFGPRPLVHLHGLVVLTCPWKGWGGGRTRTQDLAISVKVPVFKHSEWPSVGRPHERRSGLWIRLLLFVQSLRNLVSHEVAELLSAYTSCLKVYILLPCCEL